VKGQLCRNLGESLLERAKDLREPATLSGGPAGLLYRAAATVYAYATGEDPEEAGLERPVKQAARLLTRDEYLEARYVQFGPGGPLDEVVREIAEELRAVHQQLDAL
jgi:hypothetical protein